MKLFSRRTNPRDELVAVLLDARKLLALPDNDFSWSSWEGQENALAEVDELIAALGRGELPKSILDVIFAPTGPMQEVSLSSGWAQAFLDIASRFDTALQRMLESKKR